MSKQHKKRNKRYSGEDAKTTGVAGQNKPVIHHIEAKIRHPAIQWLYERKKLLRNIAIGVGIGGFMVLVIYGLVQTFSR